MGGNGRAASVPRAAGERRTKGNGGAARSAAVGKPRGKPPWTSPSGSTASAALENPVGSRLGRAHREASPRRPCKTPQKAASDEPNGKHRRGVRTRYPMVGGRVKEEARLGRAGKMENVEKGRDCPPVCVNGNVLVRHRCPGGWQRKKYGQAAGERRIKGNGGAARSAAVGKPRGRPSWTSPTGSIAAAALQNPAEGRLRRALRRASPRRPWKSPRCSRPRRGCSRGRSPPRRRRWRRGC